MANNIRNNYTRSSYVHGNTVRKLALPQESPKRRERPIPTFRPEEDIASGMNARNLLLLGIATVIIVLVCGIYINVRSHVYQQNRDITKLKKQVTTIAANNEAYEDRVASSINLEAIKEKAVRDLGMVYPSKDQIVYLNIAPRDYMNQLENIN